MNSPASIRKLLIVVLLISGGGSAQGQGVIFDIFTIWFFSNVDKETLSLEGLVYPKRSREETKRLNQELTAVNIALRDNPNDAALYVKRALLKRQAHMTEAALKDLEKALELDPSKKQISLYRSQIMMERGSRFIALDDVDRYIAAFPDSANGYLQRGLILTYNPITKYHDIKVRSADSIIEYDRALALDPDLELALIFRGYAYQLKEDYVTSMRDYQKVLAINPKHPVANFLAGGIYERMAEKSKACACYRIAKESDKKFPDENIKRVCGK
jgi:tetratricopeptide (TPR) repeat protein